MSAPRHSIFISYRRRETAFAVDQLDRALKHAFGDKAVFRDVRSIRKGQYEEGLIRTADDARTWPGASPCGSNLLCSADKLRRAHQRIS